MYGFKEFFTIQLHYNETIVDAVAYIQSRVASFAWIPNFCQALIQTLTACQLTNKKLLCYSQNSR